MHLVKVESNSNFTGTNVKNSWKISLRVIFEINTHFMTKFCYDRFFMSTDEIINGNSKNIWYRAGLAIGLVRFGSDWIWIKK